MGFPKGRASPLQYFNQRRGPYPAREVASLIKMKAEANLGTIGRAIDAKGNGVGLFAGGLLALLIVMVGVPLVMVVLMSLRTGFPGEGGPLTVANFIAVYTTPSTYKILLNTLS